MKIILRGWLFAFCGLVFAEDSKTPQASSESFPAKQEQKLSEPVRVRALAAPVYPTRALEQGVTGQVVVCFSVDELGLVDDVNVLDSSNKIFNQPTIDAVRGSLFTAAKIDGESVSSIACRVFKYWYDE